MKNLLKGLADFQNEVPTIHKDTKGFNYTYANLNAIFKVIRPLLKKHGLGFVQTFKGEDLITTLYDIKSGETLESSIAIPKGVALKGQNEFQSMGSAITYFRRYSLSTMLGLITDKDIDACGDTVKTLPTITADSAEFKQAKEWIGKGYTMEQVKTRYVVTPAIEKLLKTK